MESKKQTRPEYSVADFRRNMKVAFDSVHYTGKPVRVKNHGKDYVGVVSNRAVELVEALSKPKHSDDDLKVLAAFLGGDPERLQDFIDRLTTFCQEQSKNPSDDIVENPRSKAKLVSSQ